MTFEKDHIAGIVSRETFEKFEIYASLLEKWNPKINLVAKSTIQTLWSRHFLDSIQFFDLIDADRKKWVDIGSGGGFPGLVLTIMAEGRENGPETFLIESDQRKAIFLRTVLRETGVRSTVLAERIEETPSIKADVVTARALADLGTLLGYAKRHLAPNGQMLFAKGENWKKELAIARKSWHFECQEVKSKTNPEAVILKIQGLVDV